MCGCAGVSGGGGGDVGWREMGGGYFRVEA